MLPKEWALIGFTILSEMAIGAFWIVWLTHFQARQQTNEDEVRKLSNAALIGIGPVMLLGLIVSLFHLGSPLNAWRAIGNLGSSWLSREILFALLFFIMWFVAAVMQFRSAGTEGLRSTWTALTALVGLLAVISTGMSYMVATRPAWADVSTPLLFFATTLLLGGLAVGAVFAVYYMRSAKKSETQTALVKLGLKNISLIAMAVIVVQAVILLFQAQHLVAGTTEAQASAQLMYGTLGIWFWLRVLVGVIAGFVLAYLGWRALASSEKAFPAQAATLVLAAFVVVLVGEVIGRALFYFSVVQVNLPGVLN